MSGGAEARASAGLARQPAWRADKVPANDDGAVKDGFRRFLEEVLRWMEQQGMELPYAEDFKRWRGSAPMRREIYPPLKRLIDAAL